MTATYDAVIIGGGHNGLVCASVLAGAGRRVLVLEAGPTVGGCAGTREFHPGFRVSAVAHLLGQLHPDVVRSLALHAHGFEFASGDIGTIALDKGEEGLPIGRDDRATEALRRRSRKDADRWPALRGQLERFSDALKPYLTQCPPRIGSGLNTDTLKLAGLGWSIRRLGRDDMREFLRVVGINVFDILEDELETDCLKGTVAFDAVLGTHLGPRSPNSLLSLLYRMTGEVAGTKGALAVPKGGMGALAEAMANSARSGGVEIRTGSPVGRVLMTSGRANGVVLADGDEVRTRLVVSNADPKVTFLELLGAEHLDTGFVRRIRHIRCPGNVAKLHLALDGLPDFAGVTEADRGARMIVAPSAAYVERAFDHAKYGETSEEPAMEIVIPTVHDPDLAPEGKHVLSALIQYAPYDLKAGWETGREGFMKRVIDRIADHAPDLKDRILAAELLTPLDIEREYRNTGGHWHHGELQPDQMLMLRPVPGAAQYFTPVPGLYLCGAGSHPGGGVMGAAGMNAAHQILAREKAA